MIFTFQRGESTPIVFANIVKHIEVDIFTFQNTGTIEHTTDCVDCCLAESTELTNCVVLVVAAKGNEFAQATQPTPKCRGGFKC